MALVVKNLPANAGDLRVAGLIPGSGRSLGREDSPGAWQPTVSKSRTRMKRLNTHTRRGREAGDTGKWSSQNTHNFY